MAEMEVMIVSFYQLTILITILITFSLVQLSLNALGMIRLWMMSSRLKLMAVEDQVNVLSPH